MEDTSVRKTVLLVDDIADNLQLLRRILAPHYRVKIATSGEKAIALADCAEAPDLILLDVMMPEMDGYEVCAELKRRARTRNIPVIFVTALEDAADEEKGFAAGAVDYITKPVNPAIVLARVATHMALWQALADLEKQNSILSENVRLREQVERIMRHDLKTPLTAFIGIPALLKNRRDLPADVVESVCMLEKSGVKMLNMINSSMDLYKIETGIYKIRPVPVEMIRIVRQIEFELSELINARGLRVKICINGEEAVIGSRFAINGEETLCYSMLANFLKNAFEASPENGLISVTFYDKPQTSIRVNNSGEIPEAIRDKFLHKFVSHGKVGGTGLGGYSASLMARAMGGNVSFTSDESSGTTIIIDFSDNSSSPMTERRVGEIRALVVDDNEMLLFTVHEILRSIGLHKVEALTGAGSAISFLNSGNPLQLIIIDWKPDDAEYLELFRQIQAAPSLKKIPVVVIGSLPIADALRPAVVDGSVEFVGKPFSPDVLLKIVEGLMNRMLELCLKR